jgi:transcriptional regulator with XRE-family HTH domain
VSSPDRRRLAFGDQLRLLRESAHLSGKGLAERLNWAASKVSKIETGRQPATDSDVVAICRSLELTDTATEQQLRDELRAIRVEEARWNRRLRVGHRAIQETVGEAELAATRIASVSLTLVPGLLQTAEYARHVFTALASLADSPPDTDAAVHVRMERQRVLYDSSKRVELLVSEAALRHPVGPPSVMLAQFDRLIAVQQLPSLRFGIIPMATILPTVVMHDFVIKDDAVTIELSHTEMATGEAEDLALYERLLDLLWSVAVEGEQARALLARIAADVRSTGD